MYHTNDFALTFVSNQHKQSKRRLSNEVPILFNSAGALRHHKHRAVNHGVRVMRASDRRAAIPKSPLIPHPCPRHPTLPRHLRSPIHPPTPPKRRRRRGPVSAHGLHNGFFHVVFGTHPAFPPLLTLFLRPTRRARAYLRALVLVYDVHVFQCHDG